jgi:multiple sugar transport system ATP-binding protein
MSAPALELAGVVKRFGASPALAGVDLALAEGERLVVVGPTGAGKTTLLRIVAGLEQPDGGRVRMHGDDVTDWPPARRDVALVFQNFSLYPRFSVRANLEFPLRAPGRALAEAEIRARVAWAAELLRIPHLLEREARRLSGGEMQRVAIGRAIVRRPRLFLFDEPLSNLDAKLREALRVELVRLVRELATPMLYVTHDQAEALSMAERVCVLERGRVLQVGTPREVYERPVSPAVGRMLGQPPINTLRARRAGAQWVAADGTPLATARGAAGGEVLLGVRPEHVRLTGGTHEARVEVVEDTGPARIALVRFAGAALHALAPPDLALRPGDTVRPSLAAEHVIVWPLA